MSKCKQTKKSFSKNWYLLAFFSGFVELNHKCNKSLRNSSQRELHYELKEAPSIKWT